MIPLYRRALSSNSANEKHKLHDLAEVIIGYGMRCPQILRRATRLGRMRLADESMPSFLDPNLMSDTSNKQPVQ